MGRYGNIKLSWYNLIPSNISNMRVDYVTQLYQNCFLFLFLKIPQYMTLMNFLKKTF